MRNKSAAVIPTILLLIIYTAAMGAEIIEAATRAIEDQNDRDLDIAVELSDYHDGEFDREFEHICRIEYVGVLTEDDKDNVRYICARSEAAKRNFGNLVIDKGVLHGPGIKKLSVVLRKFSKLRPRNSGNDYSTRSPLSNEHYHQGFKELPNLVEETFHHDDDGINETPGPTSPKHHHTRKRFAKEPEEYAGQVKKCLRCFSVNTKFKYLNNNKLSQPRYLCLSCNKHFTHGGKLAPTPADNLAITCLGDSTTGFNDGHGVTGEKIRKRRAQEPKMFVGLKKECPHCKSEDAEFKYINNRKEDQPRYKCLSCKLLYQFPPKRARPVNAEKSGTQLHVPICEIPERATPSAAIEGNNIATKSSTLHAELGEFRNLDRIEESA